MITLSVMTRCFYCGQGFDDPTVRWIWMGANRQVLYLHGACIIPCAQSLYTDCADLWARAVAHDRTDIKDLPPFN